MIKKPIAVVGIAFAAILVLAILVVAITGSLGPDTSVYTGRQIPKRFMKTIRSLDLLEEDEKIIYFYSDAWFDIRTGLYFVTDRNLVLYSRDWEEPETIIPFDKIASLNAEYSDSVWDDTMVFVTTHSFLEVMFPISTENGMDKKFVEAIERNLDTEQEAEPGEDSAGEVIQ